MHILKIPNTKDVYWKADESRDTGDKKEENVANYWIKRG